MAVKKVTTALIGAGNRGVAAHGQGALRSDTLNLVAVCDVDADRAKAAGEQLRVRAETDHKKLVDDKDLQAVIIATGTRWHVPLALDFVRAGKHVLFQNQHSNAASARYELASPAQQQGTNGMVDYLASFTALMDNLGCETKTINVINALVARQHHPFRLQFFFGDHY